MSICCDRDRILARIAAKEALVTALETAILTVATTGQNYQLDTGQTRQLVTRGNLESIRSLLRTLESEISTLYARLGCGKLYGRPAW